MVSYLTSSNLLKFLAQISYNFVNLAVGDSPKQKQARADKLLSMSGIAKVFSTIDSIKRVLGDALTSPMDFLKSAGASAKESPLTTEDAMVFGPSTIGKILFHGGPQAVTKINPELGQTRAKGPGFYLSNLLNVPHKFATNVNTGGGGFISAFEMPDAAYAKMLKLNERPFNKQPELDPKIQQLLKDIPELQTRALEKESYTGTPIHGDWLDQQLNAIFGSYNTPIQLGKVGIPGKTWQYSHDRPAELASVIFPEYVDLLTPIAQLHAQPGIEGARAANIAMKAILGITK